MNNSLVSIHDKYTVQKLQQLESCVIFYPIKAELLSICNAIVYIDNVLKDCCDVYHKLKE